jgi:hypothetical protein
MTQPTKQAIIGVFLAGLMGLAWWLNRGETVEALTQSESIRRYGFAFTDVAASSGLDFKHESPQLDPKLDHIMPVVAGMGASATIIDFDGDGLFDIYAVTGKRGALNKLYRNKGDGTFEDVAAAMGVADLNGPGTGVCMGSCWADYDNDGFPDLLVYKWGRPELFHNLGGKRFERVPDSAGLPKWLNANAACWFDYDRDGKVDLFLAGYWRDELDLVHLANSEVMPESFEFAENGGHKFLLRNKGDGTFEDVTAKAGITSTRWTLGVVAADLCGRGHQDLVLANDYGVSEFYMNLGDGRFKEVGDKTGMGKTPKSGMNANLGDPLNRGELSVYISNITEAGNLVQGNNLWVPMSRHADGWPVYLNQADALNLSRGGWSWGAKFGDFNNDGRQDLYLATGYISANKAKSYWYDYGKIAGGLKGLIKDAKYWPPIGDQSLAGYQNKCLWVNGQGGNFQDVAAAVGVTDTFDGRSVSLGDLSNRGVLDVVVASQAGPLLVYKNTVAEGRDWVQFKLVGGARPGRGPGWSNRDAVGAKLTLHWKNGDGPAQKQVQTITAGDGYASQNMFRLHFGLGTNAMIEKAVIAWPSGRTQTIASPKTNALHTIDEPAP